MRQRVSAVVPVLVVLSGLTPSPSPAGPGVDVDVAVSAIGMIRSVAHDGTFPNGRVGAAMSTTACNVGTANVPWEAPMDEDHPSIGMQLYREMDGKFEQIGVSWLKHGFNVVSNHCTTCITPSTTWLGVGCSDTYGVGSNSNPQWLGPRNEVNPFTGRWTCTASYFADHQPDCVRRNPSGAVDLIERVVQTRDAELGLLAATYYYEAYYLVPDDVNRFDNLGSRSCTMSWDGSEWVFSTPSVNNPLVEGPALTRWGEMQSWASIGSGDGDFLLAVQTTPIAGDFWRYEYALFNVDSERQVGSFAVGTAGSNASMKEFHDWDDDPSNDWSVALVGGVARWDTFPYETDPDANALAYGLLFNFRFVVEEPPIETFARLNMFKPGPGGEILAIPTLAPSDVVAAGEPQFTSVTSLRAVRPNPARSGARVSFSIEREAHVALTLHDTGGRHLRSLLESTLGPGAHETRWDGRDEVGRAAAPGVYYVRLRVGGHEVAGRKLVVVR